MSTWDAWCETGLKDKFAVQVGSKCGIFDIQGGQKWASIPREFELDPKTVMDMIKSFELKPEKRSAVWDGPDRYMYIRDVSDDTCTYSVYRSGQKGLAFGLTHRTIVVGIHDPGMQSGAHSNAVYKLISNLKAANY